jgi:hypothetical protein
MLANGRPNAAVVQWKPGYDASGIFGQPITFATRGNSPSRAQSLCSPHGLSVVEITCLREEGACDAAYGILEDDVRRDIGRKGMVECETDLVSRVEEACSDRNRRRPSSPVAQMPDHGERRSTHMAWMRRNSPWAGFDNAYLHQPSNVGVRQPADESMNLQADRPNLRLNNTWIRFRGARGAAAG